MDRPIGARTDLENEPYKPGIVLAGGRKCFAKGPVPRPPPCETPSDDPTPPTKTLT